MSYRINENLSKEENLTLAKDYSSKAADIYNRLKAVVEEGNKFVPGRTFGLSKSKLEAMKSPNQVLERLFEAQRSVYYTKSFYESQERLAKEKAAKEAAVEKAKQIENEKAQLLNEAIAFCLNNGGLFGKDFTAETAISTANDIAFKLAVKKREIQIGDGYIGFSGKNCEDECDGWNPSNRRCQCGNRRVSWSYDYSDFRNMEIYAEAW